MVKTVECNVGVGGWGVIPKGCMQLARCTACNQNQSSALWCSNSCINREHVRTSITQAPARDVGQTERRQKDHMRLLSQ